MCLHRWLSNRLVSPWPQKYLCLKILDISKIRRVFEINLRRKNLVASSRVKGEWIQWSMTAIRCWIRALVNDDGSSYWIRIRQQLVSAHIFIHWQRWARSRVILKFVASMYVLYYQEVVHSYFMSDDGTILLDWLNWASTNTSDNWGEQEGRKRLG